MTADEDGYGEVTSGIGNLLLDIFAPHKKAELGLKAAITKNPELAQQFADLAHTSPESLAPYGPNALKYFKSIKPSFAAQTQLAVQPDVTESLNDPTARSYIASKTTTGATPGAVSQDRLKARLGEQGILAIEGSPVIATAAGTKAATGALPGAIEKSATQAETQVDIRNVLNQSPDITLQKLFKTTSGQEGGYSNRELNAIFSSPMKDALRYQMTASIAAERNKAAKEIASLRTSAQGQERESAIRKLLVANALNNWSKTGKGTPASWLALQLGPDNELVSQFGGVTDEQLSETAGARQDIQAQFGSDTQIRKQIGSQIQSFSKMQEKGVPEDALLAFVNNMNNLATGLATGEQYIYDKKNGLRYISPQGAILDAKTQVTESGPTKGPAPAKPNLPPNKSTPPKSGGTSTSNTSKQQVSTSFSNSEKRYVDGIAKATNKKKIIDGLKVPEELKARLRAQFGVK